MSAAFQNVKKANNIAIYICFRVFQTITDARLCCQVANNIKLLGFEEQGESFPVF